MKIETSKKFSKNDQSFECAVCHKEVGPLVYSSRDHCPFCLHSLHVDIFPGDRANTCKGIMTPVGYEHNSKKGYVINYICAKCGQKHNNKFAEDDDFEKMLAITNPTNSKRN